MATSAIQAFLADHDLDVYLAVFDKASFAVSEELLGEVASYIDEHYTTLHLTLQKIIKGAFVGINVINTIYLQRFI